jgi:hypothetical protein
MPEEEQNQRAGRAPMGLVPVPDPTILTTQQLLRELAALEEKTGARLDGIKAALEARLAAMDKAQELFNADLKRVPNDTDKQVAHLSTLVAEKFDSVQVQLTASADLQKEQFNSVATQFHERDVRVDQAAKDTRSAVDAALQAAALTLDEKFRSIQTQFIERDTRVEQTARDTRVAVDAALQAAEKAVGKQNESFALSIAKSETATQKQIDQQIALLQTATAGLNDKIDDIKDRLTRIEGAGVGQTGARSEAHTASSFTVSLVGIGLAILSSIIAALALSHTLTH